MLTLTVL